jgi:hypothetical protein
VEERGQVEGVVKDPSVSGGVSGVGVGLGCGGEGVRNKVVGLGPTQTALVHLRLIKIKSGRPEDGTSAQGVQ